MLEAIVSAIHFDKEGMIGKQKELQKASCKTTQPTTRLQQRSKTLGPPSQFVFFTEKLDRPGHDGHPPFQLVRLEKKKVLLLATVQECQRDDV
jgi:hypothetical protein